MVGSNIKSGVSIFGVSGNVVSWDRPNTFTYWCVYDSYTYQRGSYFFKFKLVPDFDDVENKTNIITQLPFASTE